MQDKMPVYIFSRAYRGTLLEETMKGHRGHLFVVKTLDQRSGAYFKVPLDKLQKDAQANDVDIIFKW